MKILVVDDDANLCRLCKLELEEEGYEVLTAYSGAGAMELFRKEQPDLAILDIRLPDMDGLLLLDQMKAIRKAMPVIMHTTFDQVYDLARSTCDGYVMKSVDFGKLKTAIRRALKKDQ